MRVKKQKQNRKTVRFYKACFAFREPYKVLCDGTFIHHMLESRLGTVNEALSGLLGGHVKVFVTRCVIEELKKLGESFSGTVLATRRLTTARCNHESLKSATECLEAMVGADNPEHFFVATQDGGLRKKFRQVPGVPVVFVQKNYLLLEPPSEYQHQIARMTEAERMRMMEREFKLLEALEAKKAATQADVTSAPEISGDEMPKKIESRDGSKSGNMLAVKDRPRFKRKKAKGPNPLSCKKKKNKVVYPQTTSNQCSLQESQGEKALGEKKRSRQRKRRHRKVDQSGEVAC
jgi:U3 small nucleolar RNA-associated protein 23